MNVPSLPKCSTNVHIRTAGSAGLKQHWGMGPCTPEKGTVICFQRWERFMAHQECSQKFLQKSGRKNILFLDENIPYLEGGREGGAS